MAPKKPSSKRDEGQIRGSKSRNGSRPEMAPQAQKNLKKRKNLKAAERTETSQKNRKQE